LEVRVFDLHGQYIESIGRSGRGPGEFRGPYAVAFDNTGMLWVADESAIRYTVFGTDGQVHRTLARPDRYFLSPGTLVFGPDGSMYEAGFLGRGERGVLRFQVDSVVSAVDTIRFPPFEAPVFPRIGSTEGGGVRIPFAPWQSTAVGVDGAVWVGIGLTYEVMRIGIGGDTLLAFDRTLQPSSVTPHDRAAVEPELSELRQAGYEVDDSRIPGHYPFFEALAVATSGHVWVLRTGPDGQRQYDIFDERGRYGGTLPAPFVSFPAPHITGEYVVGVMQDSLDVQSVGVFRIAK
jgi:hypothetical protein